ncbi:hypothetical protein [Bacillus paralicheniformis]|nr:hypothetical protein [Bacillus paralicheniformis]MEC1023546.1 hypothetical protein [Bacillus paralicheniformis]MEC1034378.1 hypothetical protein [Bacillus paralicheniformis]MEC1050240.1 hypothetical protein [Bacillus paralicheniformis]MEC1059823.1 hypothetical protein [Bacillus paralicheniformis]MEC1063233.1 hypothetical protein [Bacillus paralicheniformis]
MAKFQPQAVKLHYHGETFDTKQEIHEISDAWLIGPDIVGLCLDDDELAFYKTDQLEKQDDGYHLYEDNHPQFFMVGTSKVGADLRKMDVSELANMSFADFVRIGFSLGEGSR